ncbi:hypothetical protein Poli38472_005336 [Pythium oligandrum]|uniref:Cytochrome P450 n=1 Tax=Pythium oligandrum TaxID=41045 RepID=A0A8K1CGS5_PYTOL|nr:hypothetical protein Poli38472_005336 [Pythium oligandrum]|eukprot:TMW62718.1 hypothetical protein Poli38472_005336 [Pythium oligandrum]
MVLQTLMERMRSTTEQLERTELAVAVLLLPISLLALRRLYGAVTKRDTAMSKIKQPYKPLSTLPWLGNTIDFAKNTDRLHDWVVDICKEAQGRPVLLQLLGQPDDIVINTPELIEDVMKTQFDAFPKGEDQAAILSVLGDGIFAVDGVKWVHQRKTASLLFTARSLRESMATIVRKYTTVLLRILDQARQTDQSPDFFRLMNRFTIEVFAEIAFGVELNCLETEVEHPFQSAFDGAQRTMLTRVLLPPWFWKLQQRLGIGAEGQLQRDLKLIDDMVLNIISKSIELRQNNTQERGSVNLVTLFLDQFEKDPENQDKTFDPHYLRDIVIAFLFAGRDTTAQSLSWFFVCISRHPHVATKIRDEMQKVLPELYEGKVDSPSMEQVQQLTYLEAALKETLRLYPPVPSTMKSAARDVVLCDGTFVKKGSTVETPMYAMGRLLHVWGPDAEEFKPERWIDPETGKILHVSPYKFITFNAGPRMCLGMNLALLEIKIVAASVLSRFDVEVLSHDDVKYNLSLTLPIRGELRVKGREMLDDLFGEGIFGTDGAKWAHQRKSASNLFTARSLRESMSDTIQKHTKVLIRVLNKTCASGATVDLFKLLNQITMEAFAEIGFGIEMNGLETGNEHHFQQSFDRAFAGLMVRIMRPAWFWRLQRWFNVGAEREFKEAIEVIDKTMPDIIIKSFEERQKQTFSHGGTTDLVSLFLDRMEKSPNAQDTEFDPRDLRDLLANFLLAGRDTAAQSMCWFLLNVSRHPEVIKRIRSEIQHVIPELINGTMEIPTAEQV